MLTSLSPHRLWQIFSEICAIPHPSHHEEKIIEYILCFAKKYNIFAEQDKVGNILLRKKASDGMENCPSIVLQAHLDMVPQKNEETNHDFLLDPIQPYIDGEWVKAKNTTLGADNGIGLSSALSVLTDNTIEHGPLEVLLTVSEETGMIGATGLRSGWLQSKYLINTDSENEGEIFIGCAGGTEFSQSVSITPTPVPKQHNMACKLFIKRLKGGHSGCDIHVGRANAIKVLIRFFSEFIKDIDFRIADFQGGNLINAIPREAFITITLNSASYDKLKLLGVDYEKVLKNEYRYTEPHLIFVEQLVNHKEINRVISDNDQKILIDWLSGAPNGVIRMRNKTDNTVESSLNLGIARIAGNQIVVNYLVRSLIDSEKNNILSSLISLSKSINVKYQIGGSYSSWEPDEDSSLLKLAKHKYKELFSTPAKIAIIHAGLECGLIKKSYLDIDMISIGPTIVSPHSPDEKVNINSVLRYWNLLLAIIQSAKKLK